MEPFLILGLIGAGIGMAVARHGEKGRAARWMQRAQECGLTAIETGSQFPFRALLSGWRGRQEVRIERYQRGKSQRGTRVVVRGLAYDIGLKSEGFGTTIEKTLGSREIEIGDATFDDALFVRGPDSLLRAVLDAETRRLALDVFAGRVRMDPFASRTVDMSVWAAAGDLRAEFPDRWGGQDEPQTDTLQLLLALAERLAPAGPLEPRLAAIALHDPVSRVRGHALATLARDDPNGPATREAMVRAFQDPDPEVRLLAGLTQQDAGRPVLEALALSTDPPDSCSARAVEGLGDRVTLEVARRALEVARSAGRVKTAQAVMPLVARGGDVDAVVRALEDSHATVAAAAARALGAVFARTAEDPLLKALARDSHELRLAAAEALGLVGSARAVMPLKDLELHGRWGVDKAARQAIARIQAGLTGATPGQLALADDASGHVSLSEDPRGRVALPSDSSESGS